MVTLDADIVTCPVFNAKKSTRSPAARPVEVLIVTVIAEVLLSVTRSPMSELTTVYVVPVCALIV
jgi:hypothetical protein